MIDHTRRNLSIAIAAGVPLAGCSLFSGTISSAQIQQDIANAIGEVQGFVTSACSAWGKIVPTAETVFALLASIAGAPGIAIAAGGNIALQAGQLIAGSVCATAPPAPAPAAAAPGTVPAAPPAAPKVVVNPGNGKSPIPISFL